MPLPLPPETASALRAQIAYLRDLGIFDLYRRQQPEGERWVSPEPALAAVLAEALSSEDPEIAARKRNPPLIAPVLPIARLLAPAAREAALAAIRADIGDCTRCPLAFEGRHTIVFGDGDPNARLLFVGEGPGADEDAQGVPFIGKAGQLLNNMITAMGLKREEVYIANIVKCRPPGNRAPEPVEANTCTPFLL